MPHPHRHRIAAALVATGAVLASAACRPPVPTPLPSAGSGAPNAAPAPVDPGWEMTVIGRYDTELGETAAEIVAFGEDTMVVTNAVANSLDFVDLTDPTAPELVTRVDMAPYGGGVNSVDVRGGAVVAAVEGPQKTDLGSLVFFDIDGAYVSTARAGHLPDMVTFSPDGRFAVAANEGEPSDDYTVDPEGSITIVKAPLFTTPQPAWRRNAPGAVRQVGFRDFDEGGRRHDQLGQGVRTFGPGATVAQDLEPEYVAVDPASSGRAFVTLQENNAVATVDLAAGTITRIDALAGRDFSTGDGLDPSDRDDAIAIANHPVVGLPMPDSISALAVGGNRYYLTANEGDAREWGDYVEGLRVNSDDYVLAPEVFGTPEDIEALKENDVLGRLNVTTASGDTDGDGEYEQITAFGTRSFTVWDAATGARVWDSGSDFEEVTAEAEPDFFNSTNDEDNFDNRSDDKGPEPEAITTGVIGGWTYAFIGLERVGGVMAYDVTDPTAPVFVQYLNPREFGGAEVGPDSGPEGLEFVSAAAAPGGVPLLLAANEITGTVTVYRLGASATTSSATGSAPSTTPPSTTAPATTVVPAPGRATASTTDRSGS